MKMEMYDTKTTLIRTPNQLYIDKKCIQSSLFMSELGSHILYVQDILRLFLTLGFIWFLSIFLFILWNGGLLLFCCVVELLEHSLNDGHHHGCCGRVTDPHGEEGRYSHEAQHQPAERQKRYYWDCCFQWAYSQKIWIAYRAGRTPTMSNTRSAILLCRFQCSTATATISPPRNSMLVSFRYCMHTYHTDISSLSHIHNETAKKVYHNVRRTNRVKHKKYLYEDLNSFRIKIIKVWWRNITSKNEWCIVKKKDIRQGRRHYWS